MCFFLVHLAKYRIMEIIGRLEEKEIFSNLLKSNTSEFVAVYGRRRVGKTYLIRNYFEKQIIFDCSGLNKQNQATQLENYMDTLISFQPKFKKNPTRA